MFSYQLPPAKVGGFLPKKVVFLLKRCLQLSVETPVPCQASISPASALHIPFFVRDEKWRNQRIIRAVRLTGCSRATVDLSPLQTKQS